MAARAGLADISREHHRQIGRAIRLGRVEPMVDAFALMNRDRFDRGDVLGELLDQSFGALGNFDTVSRS